MATEPLIDPMTPEEAMRLLAGQLRQWRHALDLNVDEAAEKTGVSRGTWLRMERGRIGGQIYPWLRAFMAMGVLEDIVRASEPNLFDWVVEHHPGNR